MTPEDMMQKVVNDINSKFGKEEFISNPDFALVALYVYENYGMELNQVSVRFTEGVPHFILSF